MPLLNDILTREQIAETIGSLEMAVEKLAFDSRQVEAGTCFFAITGTAKDGHQFIPKAIELGATAIVCEVFPAEHHSYITYIKVHNSRQVLAEAASAFYEHPSKQLYLVGVTGTNGKTTTTTLLYKLFREMGHTCGLLSTVNIQINGRVLDATHTTPDPISLNRLLAEMVDEGCNYCFMEVSSHAVDQFRTWALNFKGGIFTNITHDHLDYHGTFQNYIKAKQGFFDQLPKDAFALYNIDDRNGKIMVQNTRASKYSYGLKTPADYKGRIIEFDLTGMQLQLNGQDLHTPLTGKFNAYNLLAAYAASVLLGEEDEKTLQSLSLIRTVEGRFDVVQGDRDITGIVDYAHTPDALDNVLKAIKEVNVAGGNIITVVGCGGNRDKEKRPVMATLAGRYSGKVILTNDNPRNEDPQEIINEMKAGVPEELLGKYLTILDRREAIRTACALAQQGDIVLVAGKGHEKYQEIKGKRFPFNDKEELKNCLTKS